MGQRADCAYTIAKVRNRVDDDYSLSEDDKGIFMVLTDDMQTDLGIEQADIAAFQELLRVLDQSEAYLTLNNGRFYLTRNTDGEVVFSFGASQYVVKRAVQETLDAFRATFGYTPRPTAY